ncbi:Oxysterol-binding protein-related protein 6 like protein [Argiope bruennichi]|uniref:Oxysterol-binding protein-related protein 6 like protein n=1 Tax=Argiope bruennichi TaxID=94029 RepID=A0A8T0EK89_ARGBR|nr:Oxysterol-binding protein-related protein 6 like protein [Argiope bruennichi]
MKSVNENFVEIIFGSWFIDEMQRRGEQNQLPSPSSNKKEANLFGILKNSIGKELSSITMPVEFNEPLSFLQRISEYMEYSFLLKIASQCDDPLQRLQYLSAFAVSALASNWERLCKPFNPLLGETFELCRIESYFFVCIRDVPIIRSDLCAYVRYYNFTSFAMALNELQDWMKMLPKTDSRLRPDIRMLEQGDTEGAATEKNRLEEKQRDARKQRKKKKETWKPMWFYQSKVPHIKNEIWLFNHKYWTRDFSESPDIF